MHLQHSLNVFLLVHWADVGGEREHSAQTTMPAAEITSGNMRPFQLAVFERLVAAFGSALAAPAAAMTRAAHVLSAKEPNRSAPMPAMSPTLSPTLSAMVAGFLGSSSSRPATTFPQRSAPTSAALV